MNTYGILSRTMFVPAFIDAGEGTTFKMLGTTMRLIATAAETAGRYAVLEPVTPVGWGRRVRFTLARTRSGTSWKEPMKCTVGTRATLFRLEHGPFFPEEFHSGVRNSGLTPARMILIITRGGLENYFIAISKFGLTPPSPADLAKLGALRTDFAAARPLDRISIQLEQGDLYA